MKMNRRAALLGGASLAAWAAGVRAADPTFTRAVRIVVPASPGGFTDIMARTLAPALSNRIGQSVVIENRGGAGGLIGTVAVQQAPADGYTLAMGNNNSHAMNVGLYQKLPYDPVKDFAPIAFMGGAPTVLVVHPSSPYKTVPELIAGLKAQAGKTTYGSGGVGASSHMAAELFKQRAGLDVTHVPFKGNAPAVQALLGDQITMLFDTLPSAQPLAKAGRLRALAVTGTRRVPSLPNVPTMAETLPGFEVSAWVALFAPAATPKAMVDALSRETNAALRESAMATRLAELGATPEIRGPAELAAFVASEIAKWNEVIKKAGIPPQ